MSKVLPSAAALATKFVPMVPPAPAWFSMMTVAPTAWPNSLLKVLATVSCTAPGPKGTMILIKRSAP